MIHWQDDMMTLHQGHAAQVALELTPSSIQTVVCSPPYYGLRDYGHDDQIGNEDTVVDYVQHLVDVFAPISRALKKTGTLWVNLDDSYAGRANAGRAYDGHRGMNRPKVMPPRKSTTGDRSFKNMIGVPWRFAFAMQDWGWNLRSAIIWRKTNAKPESVKDRPSHCYETLFLFSKQKLYYFDEKALATPAQSVSVERAERAWTGSGTVDQPLIYRAPDDGLVNGRDVWDIAVSPYRHKHFAVYPPELARRCIRAGSKAGDLVLDPFHGSGTTGMVALEEGRGYVGIDTNAEYLDLSLRTRLAQPPMTIPREEVAR